MSKLQFKTFPDKEYQDSWRVEALDETTGEVYIALFSGPESDRLAHEYEAFKNGRHPAAPPAAVPVSVESTPAEPETALIYMKDGGRFVIRPKDLEGTFSKRWNSLTLKPRPAMQRLGARKENKNADSVL